VPEKINEKKFICIMCPLGCAITVKSDDSGNITEIIRSKCPKGEKYVRGEFTRPMRVLTSTVAIEGTSFSRLPVRTSDLIPKDKIFECMKEIQKVKVKGPVKNGDIMVKNILGLGLDIIATRDLQ
jgi:CxxC motif-containing protein